MGRNNSDIQNLGGSLGAAMSLPIGSIVELASSSPLVEDTYLLCAGGVVNKADWPELENYVPPFTSVSSLSPTDPQKIFPFLYPIGLEFFNNFYWMLNPYALSKSADGVNWQVVLRPSSGKSFTKFKISGDNTKLIVVCTDYFQYSSDGNSWQTCATTLTDVDFNGSRWVKVSGTGDYYSDDLANLTASTAFSYTKTAIIYFSLSSRWIISTNIGSTQTGCFLYGTDGITFSESTAINSTYGSSFYKMRRVKDYVFCSSDNQDGTYYFSVFSADGVSWSQLPTYRYIDAVYDNGLYYVAQKTTDSVSILIKSGTSIQAASTLVASLSRQGSYVNSEHYTTFGRLAANPTTGDLLFSDKHCLMKRIGGTISNMEISPVAVSEDFTPEGKHSFSSGRINGILGLHFIDFSQGLFTLNVGIFTSNCYNMAFDKVFAGNSPHFWCGGMDASKYYAYAMKITVQNNNCILTPGNQCGVLPDFPWVPGFRPV
ncbi:hypothetical protein DFW101_1395 [Solidesulfovibrio carbinoliphilus subsp. oakridgensis]|uniref:Uncharacterized protein n=1 Tax=Solidesulfovibrio carbinoliphilus subsp. oakridgensis TaxID=694327 RepID=G7Q7U5_9BACT|nr:hypothetical protein [Solidesulfovibrio carbinoliphilus]EHJ47404.1 hypothetical protein DFW101_1395 [Solidesulfovibrio carbinoliphilus subsp. oakridgensis]